MRRGAALLAGALLASSARAQVTVNPGALDALGSGKPAATEHAPARRPAQTHPAPRPAPARPSATRPGPATAAPSAPARPPSIPQTPPAILALPPPVAVPMQHPPPPPPVPVADDAPGQVTTIPGGIRVTFGAGRADLNPATVTALRDVARGLKEQTTPVNIYAYAAGTPDDPSTPRRLSLSRALAARAVLINEGIASPRIYPRALGASGAGADPDRVDVVAGQPAPPAPTAAPTAAKP